MCKACSSSGFDLRTYVVSIDRRYLKKNLYYRMILSFRTDWSGQILQTQIRLLLEEQPDQGLHYLQYCLHFWMYFSVVKPFFSFRMITISFRVSEYLELLW